jgi:hypothetical protein
MWSLGDQRPEEKGEEKQEMLCEVSWLLGQKILWQFLIGCTYYGDREVTTSKKVKSLNYGGNCWDVKLVFLWFMSVILDRVGLGKARQYSWRNRANVDWICGDGEGLVDLWRKLRECLDRRMLIVSPSWQIVSIVR